MNLNENSNIPKINKLSTKIFSLLNSKYNHDELMQKIVLLIQSELSFDSVGLRLKEGLDYPYFFSNGFSKDFVEKEMYLCTRDENNEIILDTKGNPYIECMCGNIIEGRTDPKYPFFSEGGSFWSNCTTGLLANSTDDDRQTRTRNRCNGEGYESVGLFPIKAEHQIYGLLQLNDHRKNMFQEEIIPYYENIASLLGLVFLTKKLSTKFKDKMDDTNRLLTLSTVRISMLEKISKQIKKELLNSDSNIENLPIVKKLDILLNEFDVLKGISSICLKCKKIKNEQGNWEKMESFISKRSALKFSHTYCQECYEKEMELIEEEANKLFNKD